MDRIMQVFIKSGIRYQICLHRPIKSQSIAGWRANYHIVYYFTETFVKIQMELAMEGIVDI